MKSKANIREMKVFTLENEYICMKVTNIGCHGCGGLQSSRHHRKENTLRLKDLDANKDGLYEESALLGRLGQVGFDKKYKKV